ncbi:Os05g0536000, partial [Oryza sativa Japonica Group]
PRRPRSLLCTAATPLHPRRSRLLLRPPPEPRSPSAAAGSYHPSRPALLLLARSLAPDYCRRAAASSPEPRSPSAAAGSYHLPRPAPREAPSAAAATIIAASFPLRVVPPSAATASAPVAASAAPVFADAVSASLYRRLGPRLRAVREQEFRRGRAVAVAPPQIETRCRPAANASGSRLRSHHSHVIFSPTGLPLAACTSSVG